MKKAVGSQNPQHSMELKNRIRTVQSGECGRKKYRENHISRWKKLAGVTYRKIKERKSRQEEAKSCRRSNGAGGRKRKEINQVETGAGSTCQGEW